MRACGGTKSKILASMSGLRISRCMKTAWKTKPKKKVKAELSQGNQ